MGDRRSSKSLHLNFFSSLKQVEKRLKLENPSEQSTPLSQPLLLGSNKSLTESLGSPMYLDLYNSNSNSNNNNNQSCSALQESSEAPEAFLSCSPQFMSTQENPNEPNALRHPFEDDSSIDDIEELMQLLGLSSCPEGEEEKAGLELKCEGSENVGDSCHCEGGFYEKIVGVKGPKCGKEVERLDGWIKYYLSGDGEGKIEPFRLAHLLLSKAAFVSEGDHQGTGGLDFPSTIGDFLCNDPPRD